MARTTKPPPTIEDLRKCQELNVELTKLNLRLPGSAGAEAFNEREKCTAGLEAHLLYLGWLSQPAAPENGPHTRRYRTAWQLLTRGRFGADNPCDGNLRWHPVTQFEEPNGQALLDEIDRQATGPQYRILFPTIPDETGADQAHLVQVRITLLDPITNRHGLPQLLVSPWSRYLPNPNDRSLPGGKVIRGLKSLEAELRPFLKGQHLLIELGPLEGKEYRTLCPPWGLVEGGSFGLAILIAARAACEGHADILPNIVATGVLEGIQQLLPSIVNTVAACMYEDQFHW